MAIPFNKINDSVLIQGPLWGAFLMEGAPTVAPFLMVPGDGNDGYAGCVF